MASALLNPIRSLGNAVLRMLNYTGELTLLAMQVLVAIFAGRPRWRLFFCQIVEIGVRSQLVVVVTGAFTGAVFAAQTFFQFHELGMDSAVGPVVSISMCRELGPVLTGLMLAGRVGAAMSAEIGTMKVTEQIDALRAMAVMPVDYLVVPRLLAMAVSMPLLIAESIGFGILAAYYVGVDVMGIQAPYFVSNLLLYTNLSDLLTGLIKGIFFGFLIVIISCREGLEATDGAVGVGRGTTSAVVISSLTILISNFFLTLGLNAVFPD